MNTCVLALSRAADCQWSRNYSRIPSFCHAQLVKDWANRRYGYAPAIPLNAQKALGLKECKYRPERWGSYSAVVLVARARVQFRMRCWQRIKCSWRAAVTWIMPLVAIVTVCR
jgi:hypothetical protein